MATTRFTYQGAEYDLAERIRAGEIAVYERQSGRGSSSWTEIENKVVHLGVSMRRAGTILDWEQLLDIALETDVEIVEDDAAPVAAVDDEGQAQVGDLLPPADGAESAGPPPSTTTETTSG